MKSNFIQFLKYPRYSYLSLISDDPKPDVKSFNFSLTGMRNQKYFSLNTNHQSLNSQAQDQT